MQSRALKTLSFSRNCKKDRLLRLREAQRREALVHLEKLPVLALNEL